VIIGISGGNGSFSEEAADAYAILKGMDEYTIDCLIFIEPLLAALEKRQVDLAIFPIENRIGGVVIEYLPAILKHRCKFMGTFEFSVNQMLMVRPGTTRKQVTHIVSQRQALEQCKTHLKIGWKDAPQRDYIDTAAAARDLHEGKLPPTTAVIGSRAAAKLYGLEILEGPIQDEGYNYTTFIVAERLD